MNNTIYTVRDQDGIEWFATMESEKAWKKAGQLEDATGWKFSVVIA